ncbi:hypothetical protein ADU59_03440 [Pararhizobium polonicum]|uniref:Uncharacterized protein n=1 Tax=Pararhizobium polonicum TaxID=1612624 RepID=A0A1C7P6E5_9HYPH|nr:hypothetical protein ADU59_03440 [Pararhizobium polonicum]
MLAFDPLAEGLADPLEGRVQKVASGDNHIVKSGLHCKSGGEPHGFLEAPAHPVAFDGIAMLLGDGETDAWRGVRLVAIKNFEKEQRTFPLLSLANGKKLRPAFQPPGS